MLILRDKTFTKRREELPTNERYDYPLKGLVIKINIGRTKKFNKELQESTAEDKEIIKKLVKDIKEGFYYKDGPSGGDTHWLKDKSHRNKSHMMSKCINWHDRLNYRVYKPVLEYDEAGNPLPEQTLNIVLETCKHHGQNGTTKTYSLLK